MRKSCFLVTISIIIMLFSACKSTVVQAPLKSSDIYYSYLIAKGEIETEPDSLVGDIGVVTYDAKELFYLLGDFNYDGVPDLAISAEEFDSNGIEIYTLEDGQVTSLLTKYMPYSSGVETFTLAKYDGGFGIKRYRDNSIGEFTFYQINKDGSLIVLFKGDYYDYDMNVIEEAAEIYDKIEPMIFYSIDKLQDMEL